MDRLTSLTVFARIVESGGFAAAARRLGMSTTMVSNHVQSLEERLGARLLNRTTRRVSLTEVGRVYYESCVRILGDLQEADATAAALQSTPRGTLRLHVGTHIVRFVAPVVAEYMALYPQVSVDLTMGAGVPNLLEEGVDLGIHPIPPTDASLIVRRLSGWRHVLCASPRYLEHHAAPRLPADLARHNCLRYAFYPFGDSWQFSDPNGSMASARVSGALVTNSAETLRIVALAGLGVFLAPSFVVGEDIEAGRLKRLLPDYRPVEFAINAIYPHRRHVSAKMRSFIDLTAARFAEHRAWLDAGEQPATRR